MKRSTLIIGMVIGGHAVAALLLLQGCQTIHSETERPAPHRPPMPEPEITLPAPVETAPVRPTPRPEPQPPRPFPEPTTEYRVQPGDSLSGIASRFALNARDIVALNQLEDPDRIRVGQKLLLPGRVDLTAEAPAAPRRPAPATPAGQRTHEVRQGDTLSQIAVRYGVTQAAIKRANNLTDANLIRVGQTLIIPGATSTDEPDAPVRTAPRPPILPETEITPPPVEPPPAVPEPEAEATEPAMPAYRTVTVQPNEDLITLAVRWNVTPSALRELNGLTDNRLQPGQTLKIPTAP